MATIGLIAGGGRFPLLFAESARRAGHRVVAAAHVNQTDPALEKMVDACTWVKLGQFGKVLEALQGRRAAPRWSCWASITKARFFRDAWLDAARAADPGPGGDPKTDDNVLRAIAGVARGARPAGDRPDPLPARTALAPRGRPGQARSPPRTQWADARYGLELARAIGRLDLGQTVVVKDRVARGRRGAGGDRRLHPARRRAGPGRGRRGEGGEAAAGPALRPARGGARHHRLDEGGGLPGARRGGRRARW